MSLTHSDLQEIRSISREENAPIEGKVDALQNDVKEIYHMIARIEKTTDVDQRFLKLNLQQKIIKTYKDLQTIAKEAGVTLPRS